MPQSQQLLPGKIQKESSKERRYSSTSKKERALSIGCSPSKVSHATHSSLFLLEAT